MLQVNTVSELVDGLVRRNWVSRRTVQEDRRVSVLELTPAGKEFLATLAQAQIAHLQVRRAKLIAVVASLGFAMDEILSD
ncbi:MAG: Winged helix DNA-binding domain [Hyphomicrobiales bacterium]|nr:Winged helix DNA-binding domain [Hyphomicrobiales bacterium]